MRITSAVIFSLATLFPSFSFAQIPPLKNGDTITMDFYRAAQVGNEPVAFTEKTGSSTYTVLFEGNGDRKYVRRDGGLQLTQDSALTVVNYRGTPIPSESRFARFPQSQRPVAGMTWEVPGWKDKTAAKCGDVDFSATAQAKDGPDLPVVINGKEERVRTVQITYTATVSGCQNWNKTFEVFFSPELDEIIRSTQINWSREAGNGRNFLHSGSGQVTTSIATK